MQTHPAEVGVELATHGIQSLPTRLDIRWIYVSQWFSFPNSQEQVEHSITEMQPIYSPVKILLPFEDWARLSQPCHLDQRTKDCREIELDIYFNQLWGFSHSRGPQGHYTRHHDWAFWCNRSFQTRTDCMASKRFLPSSSRCQEILFCPNTGPTGLSMISA